MTLDIKELKLSLRLRLWMLLIHQANKGNNISTRILNNFPLVEFLIS